MPANNTNTPKTIVNSTDSQSFVSSNISDRVADLTSIDSNKTIVGVSKDSSPCYGLCCPKDKCKNNN
jgi:hypothetical protein